MRARRSQGTTVLTERISPRTAALVLALTAGAALGGCSAADSAAPPASGITAPSTLLASRDGSSASDQGEDDGAERAKGAFTFAVIGDTPYGPAKLAEFPSLVAKINADPAVSFVAHVGDIKAGKNAACTDEYFAAVRSLFDAFVDPLVYTPGDNEWTDCHQQGKNNGLYTPTERLAKVRQLFFPVAGRTLGVAAMRVRTQADDRRNAAYVENVKFERGRVTFATLNITGSNNDGVAWGPLPADAARYPSQAEEQAARARANAAWLARTFAEAREEKSAAVVLIFQADMWDTAEPTLAGYDALVEQVGRLAAAFGKPVLLLEGDSHVFKADNPYSASSPLHALHAATPVAENVTRIVIEGSDAGRTEYLRVAVDPKAKTAPFRWERVPLH
jgi:hypothetical protein